MYYSISLKLGNYCGVAITIQTTKAEDSLSTVVSVNMLVLLLKRLYLGRITLQLRYMWGPLLH